MEDRTLPALAYAGPAAEVMFLQTLLEQAGIDCSVDMPIAGLRGFAPRRDARLFVAPADVEAAAPLIADFRQNGVKSSF
jgi:hypothetical protein